MMMNDGDNYRRVPWLLLRQRNKKKTVAELIIIINILKVA